MKALILSVSDKRHMSMSSIYEEYFINNNIRYDIIRINRYKECDEVIKKQHEFGVIYEYPFVQSTNVKKYKKVLPFLLFRSFALKIIKKEKYDFIIVWNENTAILFSDYLLKKRGSYCVNIRDFLEIPIAEKIFEKILSGALFSTSPTEDKLWGDTVKTLYNRDINIEKNVNKKNRIKPENEKIIITFMGLYASAPKTFKKTVDLFANDNRYELRFYGDGFLENIGKYVSENNIENIRADGAFEYEDTYKYLEETDVINSYYNNFDTNKGLKYSSGVKQSYTPQLYIPAINDDNTTWANISKKYSFSYLVNDNNVDSLPDDFYSWYHNIDFNEFKKRCDEFNEKVEKSRQDIFSELDKIFINRQ